MGHYEPEWEDYNPVTDRYTYGPMKYVIDEEDRQRDYESKRKSEEMKTIRSYINSIKDDYDYTGIREAEKQIDEAMYLGHYEKVDYRKELRNRIQYLKQCRYQKMEAESERNRMEFQKIQERDNAWSAAKQRYRSLSLFGKIKYFKQRPNTISYTEKTVEELDQLYKRR